MKIRKDFVTNSSSSSFICVAKVNDCPELREYMKEEYGNFGLNLLSKYVVNGSHVKNLASDFDEFREYCNWNGIEINDDSLYLQAQFITYTTEGDTEGDDAFLYNHLPDQYMDVIYEGEPG